MNSAYLSPLTVAVLLFGSAIADAQNSAPAAPRAPSAPTESGVIAPRPAQTQSPTTDSSQTDTSRQDPATDPEEPTASHDDVTGKSLPAPSAVQAAPTAAPHPDFKTLDVNNRGYLTPDDVAHYRWLTSNFARCDANHDGRLSQQEFANCK
jgi:hypothetical protein